MVMDDTFAIGQQALAAQPFSQLIGAQITHFEPGHAALEIPIREALLQQHGFVHGGVLSYAADNALTFAGGSVLGADVLTAEYKINYLKPGSGERLLARAEVVHAGKRQAVCRCDVFAITTDGTEIRCATAQGTIVRFNRDAGGND